jgi:hypothetical protein
MSVLTDHADKTGKKDVTSEVLRSAQRDDLIFPAGRYLFDPPNRDADGFARVTLTAAFCELQRGAVLVTAGPHVRVTINAPLEVQNEFRQCFDVSAGGCFLAGPRGRIAHFTSDMFGAYGDGTLSTAAIKGLVAACLGAPEARNGIDRCHLNRPLSLGPGQFLVDDTVLDGEIADADILGPGLIAGVLVQTKPNTPIFRTNSCAYSRIRCLAFRAGADQDETAPLFDCDFDGREGTAALQANDFRHLQFDGAGRTVRGLWYGRSGFMASETDITRCYFTGFTGAAYRQDSQNAIGNMIWRCNFSWCRTNAIEVNQGTCHVLFNSFQNQGDRTTAYQIDTHGWDIVFGGGASDISCVYGNNTESLKHFSAAPYQTIDCRASTLRPAVERWQPNTSYPLGTLLTGADPGSPVVRGSTVKGRGDGKLYRSSGGTSGASEPAWADGVKDGAVTWQQIEFDVVSCRSGSIAVSILPLGRHDCSSSNLPLVVDGVVVSRRDFNTVAFQLPGESLRQFAVHVLEGAMGSATNAPLVPTDIPRQFVVGNYAVKARPTHP